MICTPRRRPSHPRGKRLELRSARTSRWAARSLLAFALMAVSVNASAERVHKYLVSVDGDLSAMTVHACFAGRPPERLVAASLDASLALDRARREGARKQLEPNGTQLRLGTQPDDACIDYHVDLLKFSGRHQRGGNPTRRIGSDLITDVGLWFWRPETLADDEDIEVAFTLPEGISVSAPWQRAPAAAAGAGYRVGHSAYDWPGTVAFGHFTEHTVLVPGSELHVAILDGRPKVDEAQTIDWLQRAADAVAQLYGRFPVASLQVVVVPVARGAEPVPAAYVLRGGGPGAHFFVNQRRPIEEFHSDWSAVHEFSHLFVPYIDSDDAWLSEGVASYYQHILRARAGIISSGEAWQSIHSAFQRARVDGNRVTLAAATERMYRNGDFMRVYWEGAAIMLLADQRLRERSGGRQSLDTVLEQLQRCCLAPDVGWHAQDLFRRLDELAGGSVFGEIYAEQVKSDVFPDLAELYRKLGLRAGADGKLAIDETAPHRSDRDAIMTGRAPSPNVRSSSK